MSDEGDVCVMREEWQREEYIKRLCEQPIAKDNPLFAKHEPYDKKKRSELQNRYLFGWVYAAIVNHLESAGIVIKCRDDSEMPWTKELLHELFKQKYLVIAEVESKKGGTLTLTKSSTKLEPKEFWLFCEEVKKFTYSFWKLSIPNPVNGYWKSVFDELNQKKIR